MLLTGGTAIAVVVPAGHPAVVVAAAFTAGQVVTSLMLARVCARRTASPRWALGLTMGSVVVLPAAAIVASAVPSARAEVAAGLSIAVAGIGRLAYVRTRRRGQGIADSTGSQAQSGVGELVEP